MQTNSEELFKRDNTQSKGCLQIEIFLDCVKTVAYVSIARHVKVCNSVLVDGSELKVNKSKN